MSKLDIIDRRLNQPRKLGGIGGTYHNDVELLIRAVRQFSGVYVHKETCNSVYAPYVKPNACDCLEGKIDPDVLELIEDANE